MVQQNHLDFITSTDHSPPWRWKLENKFYSWSYVVA